MSERTWTLYISWKHMKYFLRWILPERQMQTTPPIMWDKSNSQTQTTETLHLNMGKHTLLYTFLENLQNIFLDSYFKKDKCRPPSLCETNLKSQTQTTVIRKKHVQGFPNHTAHMNTFCQSVCNRISLFSLTYRLLWLTERQGQATPLDVWLSTSLPSLVNKDAKLCGTKSTCHIYSSTKIYHTATNHTKIGKGRKKFAKCCVSVFVYKFPAANPSTDLSIIKSHFKCSN